MRSTLPVLLAACLVACAAPVPEGLGLAAEGTGPRVMFDVRAKPLPEIPLPNDFASRFDATSPTLHRVNASIEAAPTQWEKRTRAGLDQMSGWGTLAPITVSFDQQLDLENILQRHQRPTDFADDVMYVIDVTRGSPDFCKPVPLDIGQGHFPVILDDPQYYPDEPHDLQTLTFEQEEEDLDGDGVMDPGEDTDMDGVLDHPNTLDGHTGKFDVIGFYEKETNTLIARPLYPMREATTYAVVLTSRLIGKDGNPVRSPFTNINHLAQTPALAPLSECLSQQNLGLTDVSFTWAFTTQSITSDYRAIRDGLYGIGPLAFLEKEYPVELTSIPDGRRNSADNHNVKAVPGAQFLTFAAPLLDRFLGTGSSAGTKDLLTKWFGEVDFYASATIVSPQFFPRYDANGKWLPLYDQVMDIDVGRKETFHRPETIPFFLSVPKARTGPAPVVIFMHGHSGSKLDSLLGMGPFARAGLATIGMDAVSHGLSLNADDRMLVTELVGSAGIAPLANVMIGDGRGIDQNGDGLIDSGADYFTGYVTHTRDTVRQTAVDLMQMVRTLRSFDGQRRWAFDVNRDGVNDLAGDFNGDGIVDLGGPNVPIYVAGASLGGILSSLMGGIEPDIDAIAPILPGGYLSEIGTRSDLGQVQNPLVLRMMGPLMLVHPNAGGKPALFQMVPDVVKRAEKELIELPAPLLPGSIALVRNLKTKEWRCGRVQPNGHLRLAVSSDSGDPLQVEFYAEELPSRPREGCDPSGFTPTLVVKQFAKEVLFQGITYPAGAELVALADGFGLRRGSPELRRLFSLAQIALEPADPANFAPFWEGHRTFTYGDGKTVATRALLLPMTGDPGVPVATATALMRAANFIDFTNTDPRYGKTQMQELIDVGFVEGVERTGRYRNAQGNVLMDVDVLQSVANADDGYNTPRLAPPMRLIKPAVDGVGQVGALFPMMNPKGQHSLPVPDPGKPFDLGTYVITLFADYLGSGGTRISTDACMERSDCSWLQK